MDLSLRGTRLRCRGTKFSDEVGPFRVFKGVGSSSIECTWYYYYIGLLSLLLLSFFFFNNMVMMISPSSSHNISQLNKNRSRTIEINGKWGVLWDFMLFYFSFLLFFLRRTTKKNQFGGPFFKIIRRK